MPSGRSNSNSPARVVTRRSRSRSRSPIRSRKSRSRSPRRNTGGGRGNRDVRGKECRVYVSNLNYDVKWMELKDVMKKLGTVEHVEIFTDHTGKSKGCGVVEYSHGDDAARAIKDLDGFDVMGRKIRLREDAMDNDAYMEQLKNQKEKSRNQRDAGRNQSNTGSSSMGGSYGGGGSYRGGGGGGGGGGIGNLLGGPTQFIALLNNKNGDPINSAVFVSNLDYDISWQKLKDMFRRAGQCTRCDIAQDDDNRSKGFGTVQFETPFEALTAIALFNHMELGVNRRSISVRLDRKAGLNQVMEQLGVPSHEVTQKTLSQIQSLATLAALSSAGGLGALSQLSALTAAGNPYQNLQSNQSSAAASLGLSGLSGIGGALGGLSTLLSSLGAGSSGGMMGGGSSGGMQSSSSYGGGSSMNSYGMSSQQSNRRSSDSGGRYTSYSGGGGGGGGGGQSTPAAPGCRVFVRNLPFSIKWQDLKDKFRDAGRVSRADIKTNDDGRSKGCGTVTFENKEDANRAVSLFNQSNLDGREIEVRIDQMNN